MPVPVLPGPARQAGQRDARQRTRPRATAAIRTPHRAARCLPRDLRGWRRTTARAGTSRLPTGRRTEVLLLIIT